MANVGPQIRLSNVVVTIVEPLEKTDHVESIDATDFDLPLIDLFVPILFVYRLPDKSDATYVQAVNRMKEGLRKILVPFFPWAGRWVATPGGMHRRLLCNDKGIPFIEASVAENMDSVVKLSADFQPIRELSGWEFLGMDKMGIVQPNLQPDGQPSIISQVTRFKCGGLVLAINGSHIHTDGQSLFNFLKAWSDLCRTNKTDLTLDHNRGAVQSSTPGPLPPVSLDDAQSAPGKMRVYEVSASVIELLKREAKEIANGAYVSVNDCIHAHILKTVPTLPFSINGGKEIRVATAVEGRKRFYDHPVPNLLGNIFTFMLLPKIPTGNLSNMPLSLIGSKIREKINTTARETWHSPETQAELWGTLLSDQTSPWAMTCWNGFPIYRMDFGFGTPLFVAGMNYCLRGGLPEGLVVVCPPTPGVSSSAACMSITVKDPEVLEALERHPDFLPFFLPEEEVRSQIAAHYGNRHALPSARL